MIRAGEYHSLTVARITNHGLYLTDGEENEVLLPNRYVSLEDREGDMVEVFVYHDSENRLIATREHPFAKAGEAAFLEVVDKNIHGAFLNWGITAKDLFIPNSNQGTAMEPGKRYVVFLYRDNISGRVVATTRLNGFVSNAEIAVTTGQQVEFLVAQRLAAGYRVIIENRNWGMIYDNQLFSKVRVGDRMKGYVRRITEDNRIDINLQQEGFDQVKVSADKLLGLLSENGGELPLSDDSSPENVAAATGMSKKVFKRSLGYLMSAGKIAKTEDGIRLTTKQEEEEVCKNAATTGTTAKNGTPQKANAVGTNGRFKSNKKG